MAAPAKCFLVTGSPGVGKTTLIARVLENLRTSTLTEALKPKIVFLLVMLYHHIRTGELRQGGERVGFEVVTLDGRTAPLASINNSYSLLFDMIVSWVFHGSAESIRWPTVGRYRVNVASFESLALPELQVKEDTDLFVIDEVGKMELFSSLFIPAVLRVLESNKPFLSTIPMPNVGPDFPAVARLKNHPGAKVFTITKSNRDDMKVQIYSELTDNQF